MALTLTFTGDNAEQLLQDLDLIARHIHGVANGPVVRGAELVSGSTPRIDGGVFPAFSIMRADPLPEPTEEIKAAVEQAVKPITRGRQKKADPAPAEPSVGAKAEDPAPPEPANDPAPVPSLAELRDALKTLAAAKGEDPVWKLLEKFGVKKATDVPEDRRAEVIALANEKANADD